MSSTPLQSAVQPTGKASTQRREVRGVHAVIQTTASKSLILGLQAGTGILTARILGPAGRGELAAMILWPLFVANVTTIGVPSSLIYQLRMGASERNRIVTTGFAISVIIGIAAAAAAAWLLPWWLHQYSAGIVHAAQCFLLTVPICSMTLAGRAILEASHDFSASNAIQILTPFATLIGLLLFIAIHQFNPYTAALAYIAASVPAFSLMLWRVGRTGVRVVGIQITVLRTILQYGIRSYGIDILGTLALQVDQVLVVSLLSAGAMGSYVVVLSLSRMLNVFQTSVVMVLFPKAAGHSVQKVINMTGNAVRISGLITVGCGICLCLAGPALLRIVYGPEYEGAAGALRILILEAILSGITFVLAQAFMALNRPGVVTLLQGVGLSLSVPMMLLLIPRYGMYGAAISLLVSTTVRLLFVFAGFRVFLKTSSPRLLPSLQDIQEFISTVRLLRREGSA